MFEAPEKHSLGHLRAVKLCNPSFLFMDHFLSWCSTEKKNHSVRENLQIPSPFLLSCHRRFLRLWKGKTSVYSFTRRFLPQGTTSAVKVYLIEVQMIFPF